MRSEADKKYLVRKHTGGRANAKGNLYEDYYAVFQIVTYIAKYKSSLDAVAFQTQLEDTFVDDLLITHPKMKVYHQIKNTKHLSWKTKSSGRTIKSDFENQIKDCKRNGESFALKLIYSAANSRVKDTIPDSVKDYSTAEYYDFQGDLNSLILVSDEFRESLMQVSANGKASTLDELSIIAHVFYGAWKGCNNENRVNLAEIVTRAERQKYFNLSIYTDGTISEDCRNVLDSIDGLLYKVNGRMFEWHMGDFMGCCPWSEEIERMIVDQRPASRRELMQLL